MSPHMFLLYVKTRQLPMLVIGLAATAVLAKWTGDLLIDLPLPEGKVARMPIAVAAPLAAATLLTPTLAGADPDLEHSMPTRWRRYRWMLVLATTVLCGLALTLAGLDRPLLYGAAELVRNTVGCIGLVTIGASALGARMAPLPAIGYLGMAYASAPTSGDASSLDHIWAWPMYPGTSLLSATAALVIWLTGLTIYTATRPRI